MTGTRETVQLSADCLAVEVRPDGKEFAVSTLDGSITVFDITTAGQLYNIEGRYDLYTGRREGDLVTAKRLQKVSACIIQIHLRTAHDGFIYYILPINALY